jgi:hypothetical protein
MQLPRQQVIGAILLALVVLLIFLYRARHILFP